MHPRAVQKHGQFEIDTDVHMQSFAYFHPYLFRTGDAKLGYVIYEHAIQKVESCMPHLAIRPAN